MLKCGNDAICWGKSHVFSRQIPCWEYYCIYFRAKTYKLADENIWFTNHKKALF